MQSLPRIDAFAEDLTALRHDFHAHPELGFQEHRTSARIAGLLESWGIEVTRGIGGTGLVGVLQGRGPGRRIGLRADMDALPMEELTNLPYASKTPGVFHGCGHDGHITMLLGAARYLAETRDFDGTAIFIFQPAEEGLGGARAMIEDGLFERFPCDELYGLHNSPYHPLGQVTLRPGLAQAGACFFDIRVQGQGAHGAYPHLGKDPVTIGAGLVKELQEITARNADPLHPVVVSVTAFRAGEAYNVIPDRAELRGTFRFLRPEDRDLIDRRMRQICAGMALAHGVAIEVDIRGVFSPLRNDPQSVEHLIAAARDVVGEKAAADAEVIMGSEDMADFLAVVPGVFFNLGHGSGVPVHNPHFILDDRILPVGASIFARLVERRGTR
ncbi:M20 aminoacylase family protein [Pararhodobacter sp.]|uniref:M20 aminoacylase family protein n=1 Tax=Pararhodobacter sp. TaxID=2127056 RepID=UPI002FE1DA14